MMNDLFPYLGNPTIKSRDMSLQIAGVIENDWSVLRGLMVSPLLH
jgi:hypothetical protein